MIVGLRPYIWTSDIQNTKQDRHSRNGGVRFTDLFYCTKLGRFKMWTMWVHPQPSLRKLHQNNIKNKKLVRFLTRWYLLYSYIFLGEIKLYIACVFYRTIFQSYHKSVIEIYTCLLIPITTCFVRMQSSSCESAGRLLLKYTWSDYALNYNFMKTCKRDKRDQIGRSLRKLCSTRYEL
jgi:hypothetical protein